MRNRLLPDWPNGGLNDDLWGGERALVFTVLQVIL